LVLCLILNLVCEFYQELNKRQAQLEYEHQMLLRHHDSTRELEFKQLENVQKLRDEHLRKQHITERQNQQNYNTKAEQDLRKKHALEQKQQPRSLRVIIERINILIYIIMHFMLIK